MRRLLAHPRLAAALPLAGLGALVLLAKAPTLDIPLWWDEIGYAKGTWWLAQENLVRALPGLRPAGRFWGHPPGFHLLVAIPWKALGPSISAGHLVAVAFSAVGVCGTYLVARDLFDRTTGLLAAGLLFLAPLWFAQSGMLLTDVPVAALGIVCVHLASKRRWLAYALCGTAMVLIKETGAGILAAILVYECAIANPLDRRTWRRAVPLAAPLAVLAAFVLLQKATTGHAAFILPGGRQLLETEGAPLGLNAELVTEWIFARQHRFVGSALVVLNLLLNPAARRPRALLLFPLVVAFACAPLVFMRFLPRYALTAFPLFAVLVAGSVVDLARATRARHAPALAAGAATVLAAWSLAAQPVYGNGETNMTYVRIVAANRAVVRHAARAFPGRCIHSLWPQDEALSVPRLGWVDAPAEGRRFLLSTDFAECDVALNGYPGSMRLRLQARAAGWTLVDRAVDGPILVELYARPAADRGGPEREVY